MIAWLRFFGFSLYRWLAGKTRPLRAIFVQELPDRLSHKVVYIGGEGEHKWYVAMLCPCGCGEVLYMSLMQDSRPRWGMVEHRNKTISLQPSVWRKIGCKSHFFLKEGCIQWCADIMP